MGRFHRNPKTTQERRINGNRCEFIWEEDFCVKCRSSRSMSLLVESWDDIIRKDIKNNNWKRFRRTQYRCKII